MKSSSSERLAKAFRAETNCAARDASPRCLGTCESKRLGEPSLSGCAGMGDLTLPGNACGVERDFIVRRNWAVNASGGTSRSPSRLPWHLIRKPGACAAPARGRPARPAGQPDSSPCREWECPSFGGAQLAGSRLRGRRRCRRIHGLRCGRHLHRRFLARGRDGLRAEIGQGLVADGIQLLAQFGLDLTVAAGALQVPSGDLPALVFRIVLQHEERGVFRHDGEVLAQPDDLGGDRRAVAFPVGVLEQGVDPVPGPQAVDLRIRRVGLRETPVARPA